MPTKNMPTSPVDGLPIRPSGSWIRKKHHYLNNYLGIFSRGMGRMWSEAGLTYIDLFAGPGRCLINSSREEVDGSPLIALNYPFSKYIFVENDAACLSALKARCKKSPKFSQIEFIQGDCNIVVGKIRPAALNFAFADPTGIDVHFETIKTLADGRRIDFVLNIPLGVDIKRNLHKSYRRNGSRLDRFLGGCVDWATIRTPRNAIELFKERIKSLGYLIADDAPIEVRNSRNVSMYFLLFISKNPRGVDFWNKICKKDESGQGQFDFNKS